jgi:hypothetical protein
MPTLDDVYRTFGFTAEAAQLLETELGNALIKHGIVEENLVNQSNPSALPIWSAKSTSILLVNLSPSLRSKISQSPI